jgi:DNA-binding response OmpR family regulator
MSAKILIVEDDEDIRRGLNIRLRASGFTTLCAQDGITAVSMAQRERPDLVLLDLGLPGGDGFVVMNRLRTAAATMPVIVLSARDPLLNRNRALEAGARAFLQKPVDNDKLLESIRQALSGDDSGRAVIDGAGGGRKVLIVEDDPDIRRGLSIRLKVNQYETVFATDAISAISVAQRERPDLILLDLGLPGGDGFVVMDRLRSGGVGTPIIVLSARDPLLSRDRALSHGALAFLQKPVDNDVLLATIRQALQGGPAPEPAAQGQRPLAAAY